MKSPIYIPIFITICVLVILIAILYYSKPNNEGFISISEVADATLPRAASHISTKASEWVNDKKAGIDGGIGKMKEDWRYLNDAETFEDLEKRWESTKAEYIDSLVQMGLIKREEHFAGSSVDDMATIEAIIRELPSYESQSNDIYEAREKAIAVNVAAIPTDKSNYSINPIRMRYDDVIKKFIIDTQCEENTCKGKPIQIEDSSIYNTTPPIISNGLMKLRDRYSSQIDLIVKHRDNWANIKKNNQTAFIQVISTKVPTTATDTEESRKKSINAYIDSIEARLNALINQWNIDKAIIDSAVNRLSNKTALMVTPPTTQQPTPQVGSSSLVSGIDPSTTMPVSRSTRGRVTTRRTTVSTPPPTQSSSVSSTSQVSSQTSAPTSRTRVLRGRTTGRGGTMTQLFTDYVQKIEGFLGFNQTSQQEYFSDLSERKDERNYMLLDLGNYIPPYLRANEQPILASKTWHA
jgi:hypothetical protein